MELYELFVWLTGFGATVVASYFAERYWRFQALNSEMKRLWKTVVASVIAIIAFLTIEYVPVEFWSAVAPYWKLVFGVIVANYGTEVFHFFDRKLAKSIKE